MALFVNTTYRSNAREIMDDFSMKGDLLRDTLDKLGKINKWLGGNGVTINGVLQLLRSKPKATVYTIVDLGCGHGDMLRLVAKLGRKKGYNLKLIGIDANQDTIDYANELSKDYPEISYYKEDIFSEEFKARTYDIVLSTLFFHHFKDEEIITVLKNLCHKAQLGVVINDLHRSTIAYGLFKCIGLFISNEMIRQDGLTSILRAFKRKDLENYSRQLNHKSQIQWKWAFRYQWIIKTNQ